METVPALVCQDRFPAPRFLLFSSPALCGKLKSVREPTPPGSGSERSANIDVVRQDGSFPPVWKSSGVGSRLVNPLLQQTNKVDVCRLNRARGPGLGGVTLNPSHMGASYLENVWRFSSGVGRGHFWSHVTLPQPRLVGIRLTGRVPGAAHMVDSSEQSFWE